MAAIAARQTSVITIAFGPMNDMAVITSPPTNGIIDFCFQP